MKLKFIIPIFIFLSVISCKSDKPNSKNSLNTDNKSQDSLQNLNNKQVDSYFNYNKWSSIDEENSSYKHLGFSVEFKNYFNEARNEGGRKLFVNNKEIDFIITDAYVLTPYLFIDKNEKIVLIKEEDEGGIYGFMVYYFENNKYVKKEYLNIAPTEENFPIQNFIRFKNNLQDIQASIITSTFNDTKTDKIKPSNEFNFIFSKKVSQKNNSNTAHKKTECKEIAGDMMSGEECTVASSSLEKVYQEIVEKSLVTDSKFLLPELPRNTTSKSINENGIIEISYKINPNSVIIEMLYAGGITDIELHKQNDLVKRIIRYNYD